MTKYSSDALDFLAMFEHSDPDRPKNDKGTIVSDTIQVLKDLNSEMKKLKKDHALLCEESHEVTTIFLPKRRFKPFPVSTAPSLSQLTQEKNEIREEKASLKSDIQSLTAQQQHQQTRGFMVPWDSQILMAPPYPYPVAVPMHRAPQAPPFFANQPNATQAPCSTYIPYLAPVMPRANQPAALNGSASYVSRPRASKVANSNDVATDLELKMPGSAAPKVGFVSSTRRCDMEMKVVPDFECFVKLCRKQKRRASNVKRSQEMVAPMTFEAPFLCFSLRIC